MYGINQQLIVGNLGEDPEIRFTQSGQAVCNLRVAVTSLVPQKEGPAEERTSWHNVVAWGRLAESCKGLRKGDAVCAVGETRTRTYDDREGVKRYQTEVIATFLGGPLAGEEPAARRGGEDRREAPRDERRQEPRGDQRAPRDAGRRDDRRDDRRPAPPREQRQASRDGRREPTTPFD